MRVWRICKAEHAAAAFTGEGAAAYAGRWHHAGTPVVYTSESRALAALEQLVHLHRNRLPPHFVCFAVEIPDDLTVPEVRVAALTSRWHHHPGPLALRDITLEENGTQAGIIRLDGPPRDEFVLDNVGVTPADRPFVIEGGPPPTGWQAGIVPVAPNTAWCPCPRRGVGAASATPWPACSRHSPGATTHWRFRSVWPGRCAGAAAGASRACST